MQFSHIEFLLADHGPKLKIGSIRIDFKWLVTLRGGSPSLEAIQLLSSFGWLMMFQVAFDMSDHFFLPVLGSESELEAFFKQQEGEIAATIPGFFGG